MSSMMTTQTPARAQVAQELLAQGKNPYEAACEALDARKAGEGEASKDLISMCSVLGVC